MAPTLLKNKRRKQAKERKRAEEAGAATAATLPSRAAEAAPPPLLSYWPATAATLLTELLDLSSANPGNHRVLVSGGAASSGAALREVPHGGRLGQLLPAWKASLVSGFLRHRVDGTWDYHGSVQLLKATHAQTFDPALLDPADAVNVTSPLKAAKYQKLLKWGTEGDWLVVWDIAYSRLKGYPENGDPEEKLLNYALSLVVFNTKRPLGDLQAAIDDFVQAADTMFCCCCTREKEAIADIGTSGSLPGPPKEGTSMDSASAGGTPKSSMGDRQNHPLVSVSPKLQASLSSIGETETRIEQEQLANLPVDPETLLKFLREPEVGSDTGFQMRSILAGHPAVMVVGLAHLLGLLREQDIAACCDPAARRRRRVVLSDIDDTVHPAHDASWSAVAGMDTSPVAEGEIYPDIEKVHRALRPEFTQNRRCYPVFLSARPPALARKHKPELQLLARRMVSDTEELPEPTTSQELHCSIMPGADSISGLAEAIFWILFQSLPTMQKGMIVPLGRKKIERVYDYVRLFPDLQYVFIGDDGQGDFEAARGLLELRRTDCSTGLPIAPPPGQLFELLDACGNGMVNEESFSSLAVQLGGLFDGMKGWAMRLVGGEEACTELLQRDLQQRGRVTFPPGEPALFDFVAIKAVRTNKGYLFDDNVRAERQRLMREIYGQKRFFYFTDYAELLEDLRNEGWAAA